MGVNFFDTANVYEQGAAEMVVGETLRGFPRESYVLATKVFGKMGDGPNDQGLSRKHIMEQCHDIMKGIEPFELEEEPYRFIFDPFTDKTVLLQYEYEGDFWPAAWCHTYGIGRVVFLMPGHHEPSFLQPSVRSMITQAAKWASRFPG